VEILLILHFGTLLLPAPEIKRQNRPLTFIFTCSRFYLIFTKLGFVMIEVMCYSVSLASCHFCSPPVAAQETQIFAKVIS